MIAYAGWRRLAAGERDEWTLSAEPDLPLGPRIAVEAVGG
jgi:hypothetical protein